jgi:murein DD-endopeptidase MepM/ murein hydrolase activator NlpD
LPFPAGAAYRLGTSYCGRGGHPNSIAYDFDMPVGADVVAARAGEVVMVWEDTPDEPDELRPNGFYIEHDDGSIGSYAHITQNGVLVDVGDRVEQGQVVAIGGTSGTSAPHLHFMVYQRYPTRVEDDDVPVNFRNADGPLDERGGLMWGYVYRAMAPSG